MSTANVRSWPSPAIDDIDSLIHRTVIKILYPDCEEGEITVNHSDSASDYKNMRWTFLTKCHQNLPELHNLPIVNGCTNYPYLKEPIDLEIKGWTTITGYRLVLIIDGYILFQRYTNDSLVMYSQLTSDSIVTNFREFNEYDSFSKYLSL